MKCKACNTSQAMRHVMVNEVKYPVPVCNPCHRVVSKTRELTVKPALAQPVVYAGSPVIPIAVGAAVSCTLCLAIKVVNVHCAICLKVHSLGHKGAPVGSISSFVITKCAPPYLAFKSDIYTTPPSRDWVFQQACGHYA